MPRGRVSSLVLSFLWVLPPSLAGAVPVTWVFEGTVESTASDPGSSLGPELAQLGVAFGATVSGSLTFETTTPDDSSEASFGRYVAAVTDFTLTIGSYSVALAQPGLITISDSGSLSLSTRQTQVDSQDALDSTLGALFGLELQAQTAGVFDPSFLDPDPPPLELLAPFRAGGYEARSAIYVGIRDLSRNSVIVLASISRVERVPEPGTALLFGVAFAVLRARRSWR